MCVPNYRFLCLFVHAAEKSAIYRQTPLRIFKKMALHETTENTQLTEY